MIVKIKMPDLYMCRKIVENLEKIQEVSRKETEKLWHVWQTTKNPWKLVPVVLMKIGFLKTLLLETSQALLSGMQF